MTTTEILRRYGACDPAIKWVGERTPREAWEQCDNPQWLLWAAGNCGIEKTTCVRIACRVARSVMHLATTQHAGLAIEAAEAWIADPSEANRLEAYAASAASASDAESAAADADAAADAYAASASDAAAAASYAASAAASYAASAAADAAASAAAYAAYAAGTAAHAADAVSRAASCAIIREEIPWADVAAGLGI